MVPCEHYGYLVSVLGLHNMMAYGPRGEAFVALVRDHYHGSPSGGADTRVTAITDHGSSTVNVTVDEGVVGRPTFRLPRNRIHPVLLLHCD